MIKSTVKRMAGFLAGKVLGERFEQSQIVEQDIDTEKDIWNDINDLFDLFSKSDVCGSLSQAQLRQDIVVLLATNFKVGGFFVEFGATNGFDLSNTYLLEKKYGWKGILVEPATVWHDELQKNRDAIIDFSCVWSKSDEVLAFNM